MPSPRSKVACLVSDKSWFRIHSRFRWPARQSLSTLADNFKVLSEAKLEHCSSPPPFPHFFLVYAGHSKTTALARTELLLRTEGRYWIFLSIFQRRRVSKEKEEKVPNCSESAWPPSSPVSSVSVTHRDLMGIPLYFLFALKL